jgi:predicted phosphodiesterase
MTDRVTAAGPVLVFGGPYSNAEATEAVLAEGGRRGIDRDHVICTGDIVAYCADAQRTVDIVRNADISIVRGNCEEQLATGAEDCGCGFEEGTACAVLSDQWYGYALRHVDADSRAWLGARPARIDLEIAGLRFAIIHGAPGSVNRFVFFSMTGIIAKELADLPGYDGVIGGHSGLPFTRTANGRLWHNAGAIGLPANDGTPRVWYSVLTPTGNGLTIEHIALSYDHAAAARKMRTACLPEGYAAALETGLWPSCDVLPTAELGRRGTALAAGTITWRNGEDDSWQG